MSVVHLPDADDLIPEVGTGVVRRTDIMGLLETALQKGHGVEAIEKLVALEERMSARAAAKEFNAALARFQAECPAIQKTSTAKVMGENGGVKFTYNYAELDEIADTVRPVLHELGFSYTWDTKVEERVLHVTCTLRHLNGHLQTALFSCPVDTQKAMSAPQQHASTLTFARRYSLIQVLGLTTTDPDPDGTQDPKADPDDVVRLEEYLTALDEDGVKIDRVRFLAWLGVKTTAELTAKQVERAMRELKRKADKARA